MARHEADREDLMRDAVALKRRIEICIPAEEQSVIAGFRANGSLAIYFGADPVYQFDSLGGLRRAFINGFLFRTHGTTLARLTRIRTQAATELHRHDLTADELQTLLSEMQERLQRLLAALRNVDSDPRETMHDPLGHSRAAPAQPKAQIVQQIPPGDACLAADLANHIQMILAAENPLAPQIPGKR